MLSYLFPKKKKKGYLYITFKHRNTIPKIKRKKEFYCMCKACMISRVLYT